MQAKKVVIANNYYSSAIVSKIKAYRSGSVYITQAYSSKSAKVIWM